MTLSNYHQRWEKIKSTTNDPAVFGRLARQIAASFLDAFLKDGSYAENYIALLCEMGTQNRNARLNDPAARALFGIIIERLCDEFEELPTEFYNQVMAQVISYCRQIPPGEPLDRKLSAANIMTSDDIIARAGRIRGYGNRLPVDNPPRKIFVLSRVTIGADVAVTSVILQRLSKLFPSSELILIGPAKCREIFCGHRNLVILPVDYHRNGGIIERLDSWLMVQQVISKHTESDDADDALLIDPDSRLSQLGLLPLMAEDRYFYFDSRSTGVGKNRLSIGALANSWLDTISGKNDFVYPGVWPEQKYLEAATLFCQQLRRNGARRLVVVNFGVGGNPRKKISLPFEQRLLQHVLNEPETAILLDKGFGADETDNSNQLMENLTSTGQQVQSVHIDSPPAAITNSTVMGLRIGIGELAALIKNCDEYIGYDSAGQHMAAALEVPCTTVFAGSNSMRFIQRWAALGPGRRCIVHVDTLTDPAAVNIEDVISRIVATRGSA